MRGCARSSQMTARTEVSTGKPERRLPQACQRDARAGDDDGDREPVVRLGGEAADVLDRHRVLEQVDAAEPVEQHARRDSGDVLHRAQAPAHDPRHFGPDDDVEVARIAHRAQAATDAAQLTASSNSSASAYSCSAIAEDDRHARAP